MLKTAAPHLLLLANLSFTPYKHSMHQTKSIGYGYALLATFIWSGNFIIARGLGETVPPITLATLRWLTASLVVLPFAIHILRRDHRIIRANLKRLTISALLGVTVFNTLIYTAAHTTDALNLTLIATTTPVFIVILSRLFLGETISRSRAIGLLCAIVGIITLVTRGHPSVLLTMDFHVGDLWMLGACLCWAAYSIHIKGRPQEIGQFTYLAMTILIGVLPLIPAAMVEHSFYPAWTITPTTLGAILYIGIGASLGAFYLWSRAIATIGPPTASIVYYSLPIFSGVEAYLILGESVTWAHVVGFAFILCGILVATHPRFSLNH